MGRFSPTVTPTWGQSFGAALNGGVQSFLSTRRQKMEDEEAMYARGLQPVDPNAPQAVAPMPTQGQVNGNIAQNVGMPSGPELAGALNGPPPQRGGIQQTPSVPSHLVAQALANHVQSGQPLTAPGTPIPSSEPAPIHLMGRDWRMTDQARAQMALANALKNAEIESKGAEAYKNRREGGQLRLGDQGYAQAQGDVAGAQAGAQVAPHLREAAGRVPLAVAQAGGEAQAKLPLTIAAQNNESGNTLSREKELIPLRSQATVDAFTARQNAMPLHQDEAYAAQHLSRIASSLPTIEAATAPSAWQKIAQRHMLGNYTLTPEGQKYNAAVDRAALSVAVMLEGPRGATPQRVEIVKNTYFPKPGDEDSTVKAKIQQLREVVRDGARKAGRGYERMDPRSRAAVDHYIGDDGTTPSTDRAANPFESLVPQGKTP